MHNQKHTLRIHQKRKIVRDWWDRWLGHRSPFGRIELFSTDDRRRNRLPHQGIRECARRAK